MSAPSVTRPPRAPRSRYGFALLYAGSLLAVFTLLRVALYLSFARELSVPAWDLARVFLTGCQRDLVVVACSLLPLLFWFLVLPDRAFARWWHRALLVGGFFLYWLVQVFLIAAEFYFFDEFKSRFNTVAVDYLLYPQEVFINIWDSYPVVLIVGGCALLSAAWLGIAHLGFRRMWEVRVAWRVRAAWFAGAVLFALILGSTITLRAPKVSAERALNEIANNGTVSFIGAFFTRHLDYAAFYRTLPPAEATRRVRKLLQEPGVEFVGGPDSIRRHVAGDPMRPRLNVVLILEESLGSEFFGSLGRKEETLTPEMDRLAATEGLLFTNIYATGNRTIRGFEGVLSSFPPLPGDSIVARDLSQNVETIARVLKRDGYETLFLYGGRGLFDGMRAFAVNNGYDRFIEQKHFEKPTFATIWGVCDEDLFARTIAEMRELERGGKPFLATVLSVSNHKPYTYPAGRIREDPNERKRENAVKYSDFALGEFFRAARKEAFWTNTVFVMVADHGARVYGSQSIPIHSYEIPLLIAGPAVVRKPERLGQLGCSMDVSPTILGLIGRPYDTLFLGRDLLKGAPAEGRVFINHNRDIGLYAAERLVVLGLMRSVEYYRGDPKREEPRLLDPPGPAEIELEHDATAVFQVADDWYINRRYRLDER